MQQSITFAIFKRNGLKSIKKYTAEKNLQVIPQHQPTPTKPFGLLENLQGEN